ncbi:MAG TPA: hypothetical protein VK923_13075 [Euzebyales bacterium]|nr:hypothetical protein [Euzebyales bacterium]
MLFNLGRIDEALAVGAEGLRWAADRGILRTRGTWLHANMAEFLLRLGRLKEARAHVRDAVALVGTDISDVHVRQREACALLLADELDGVNDALAVIASLHHGIAAGSQMEGPAASSSPSSPWPATTRRRPGSGPRRARRGGTRRWRPPPRRRAVRTGPARRLPARRRSHGAATEIHERLEGSRRGATRGVPVVDRVHRDH